MSFQRILVFKFSIAFFILIMLFQYPIQSLFVSNEKMAIVEKKALLTQQKEKIKKVEAVKKVAKKKKSKKEYFKDTLVPIITSVYKELNKKYYITKKALQENKNHEYIANLKKQYKAKTDEELLHAMKPHPISIVLAQSAIESAWLTSRFTKDANNIFGVWSFNKKEPRIEATGSRGDKKIYLKKYNTLEAAVRDYYKSIGKSWAYKEFRRLRTITDDPYELLPHMGKYSEKGLEYTETLAKMIKYNQFDKYDIKDTK